MKNKIEKYGLSWSSETDEAQIECWMIKHPKSKMFAGEFHHYKRLFRLYWPEEDEHRWEDSALHAILDNQFTTLMGCTGSAKTSTAAKFALCFYSVWPEKTTILISSTDTRGLELRVFGRLKELIEKAKDRFDWFPGHVIDSKKCILTDDVDEDEIRNQRDGITCIPCLSSQGTFIGISKYIGIHNTRMLLIGDEFQLMQPSILDSIPNLLNNPTAKFIFLGNPLAQNDPLDKVSEPKDGWSSIGIPKKTMTWSCRYMNGLCLCLPGMDSPNYDYPEGEPDRYPYMVGRTKERQVRESYGEGSQQYCSQILGVRLEGLTARKVITRDICVKFDAFRIPTWHGEAITKIYAIDAAYSSIGGDLCVAGYIEFGTGPDGKQLLNIGSQKIIPISGMGGVPPDDQIAIWVRQDCESNGIPPENVYFDGRTMLMSAFARLWSGNVNPVDFGGRTTDRPVSLDMKIQDLKSGQMRLKLCSEHYSKFVTELWFSLRLAIESGQICGMTEDILIDAIPREWKTSRNGMIEIESKLETKKRTGRSPDRTDHVVTAIEGARRKGFMISKLSQPTFTSQSSNWLRKAASRFAKMQKERVLQAA